jgi:hypothetical protein
VSKYNYVTINTKTQFNHVITISTDIYTLLLRHSYTFWDFRIIKHEGSLIDASFVDVPRQRNTHEENQQIKDGQISKD